MKRLTPYFALLCLAAGLAGGCAQRLGSDSFVPASGTQAGDASARRQVFGAHVYLQIPPRL